ncbi:MAG: putative ABC transport system permease protein [Candidatus Krumholzibacteriia bacterium]|jgi:putative ABC transport system permease protein
MNLLEGVRLALSNLRGNKLRTFLTLLGNIVGTMSVITVVSLIYGVDRYVSQVVLDEGTDVFTITRTDGIQFLTDIEAFFESLNNPDLTLDDREWLAERMTTAKTVGAMSEASADLHAGSQKFRGASVRGVTEDYTVLEDLPLVLGRHFSPQDVLSARQVAVIGYDVARDLFPRRADPVGLELKIAGRHFRIIGVVEDRGTVMGNNRNQFVMVPLTAWFKVFGAGHSLDIKVAAADLENITATKDEATFLMRMRHRLRPLERQDFALKSSDQMLSIWGGISKAIYGALVPLVGISLVVGGIVLMNIMLVSVTERTREVGVRMALGARRKAIMGQFLIESVTLSIVGGAIGILVGMLLAWLISIFSPLPFAIAGWSLVLSLGTTFVIGAGFGTYPAWKAAGLDPVEALRHG